jgi:hypothetical protein
MVDVSYITYADDALAASETRRTKQTRLSRVRIQQDELNSCRAVLSWDVR